MRAFKRISMAFRQFFKHWDRTVALFFKGVFWQFKRLTLVTGSWLRRRSWLHLAQGMPALGAASAIVVLMVMYLGLPAHEVEARYQERAATASKAKEFPTALICYERLAALGQDRPENLYEMALALEAQGQPDRAFEVMLQLAPIDRTGYGPAHQWLALRHLKKMGDSKERKLAEAHLVRALDAGVPDPDAVHGLLGEVYFRSGRLDDAEKHLERAVKSRLHMRLRYAQVLRAQDKKGRAIDEGKKAAQYFQTRASVDVNDRFSRIAWAECVTFLEEFPQALAILKEGLDLTNDTEYRAAMARVYLAWHIFVLAKEPENRATQWSLLEKGLQLDGTNPQLLDRLVGLMGQGGDDAEKARAVMRTVLAKGEATATAHFLLGLDAWQRDDKAQAEIHWERAYELSPNLPDVANNLAWLLAHAGNGDPPRALKIIEQVLAKFPQNPAYRHTRASIHMKMAKWRAALSDLEYVLQRDPNHPGIHGDLAEVYEHLENMQALAAEHRRLAEAAQTREKKRKAANK